MALELSLPSKNIQLLQMFVIMKLMLSFSSQEHPDPSNHLSRPLQVPK